MKALSKTLVEESNQELEIQALREESKNWSRDEWEAHLQTVEVGLKESHSSLTEVIAIGVTTNIFDFAPSACREDIADTIETLLSLLTERQKFVICQVFYEGKSERDIANAMGISRTSVQDLKERALKKMQKFGPPPTSTFPIVREQVNSTCSAEEDSNCEQGQEQSDDLGA